MNLAAPLIAVAAVGAYLAFRQGQGQGAAVDMGTAVNVDTGTWADQWAASFEVARDALNWSQEVTPLDAADTVPTEGTNQETSIVQDVSVTLTGSTWGQGTAAQSVNDSNARAFLDMIAFAEGTSGQDGYRTLFGGGLFDSYADHPRKIFTFTNSRGQTLNTSAAGRYQFLARTWDSLKSKLGLQDFSPTSQDIAALELVRQRGALGDVKAGRIASAIAKCAPVWASLPGAGYAQPERKTADLLAAYQGAGGQLLTA